MIGFYIILLTALVLLGAFSWLASHYHWFESPKSDNPDNEGDEEAAPGGGGRRRKLLTDASVRDEEAALEEEGEGCCGQHLVCQKDKQLMAMKDIVYFDDEELDAFKDTPAENYNEENLALFSDIFYTIRPEEMMDWLNSLRLRGIELPIELRDEALLIISDRR